MPAPAVSIDLLQYPSLRSDPNETSRTPITPFNLEVRILGWKSWRASCLITLGYDFGDQATRKQGGAIAWTPDIRTNLGVIAKNVTHGEIKKLTEVD